MVRKVKAVCVNGVIYDVTKVQLEREKSQERYCREKKTECEVVEVIEGKEAGIKP